MNKKLIEKLQDLGGNRWTKGDKDRLYFDDSDLGFEYECYKSSGRVNESKIVEWPYLEGADMEAVNERAGETLSNREATSLAGCKHYIDLETGEISSFGFFEARIQYLMLKARKELEAQNINPDSEYEVKVEDIVELTLRHIICANYKTQQIYVNVWQKGLRGAGIKSIKLSEDKRFAYVIANLNQHRHHLVFDLKKDNVKISKEEFILRGEILPPRSLLAIEEAEAFKNFVDAHEWSEIGNENPDPTPTKTREKKYDVKEATTALEDATTAEAVKNILAKTCKDALMEMAKAAEEITGVHVKSNAGRSTLENVLIENAEKLISFNFIGTIKLQREWRKIRKTTDTYTILTAKSRHMPLVKFTKKQLVIIAQSSGIFVKINTSKAKIIEKLNETNTTIKALIA